MKVLKVIKAITVASVVLLSGCATNHQAVDSEASSTAQPVSSIAIFAVTSDLEERVDYENAFTSVFASEGITAGNTYDYSPNIERLDSASAISDMYRQAGADSGLTIEVVKAQSEGAKKTGAAMNATWWAGLILDQPELLDIGTVGTIAAYSEAGKYQLRVSLWDASTGECLWTMDTESFSNGNTEKDATKLAEMVAQELRTKGLLL